MDWADKQAQRIYEESRSPDGPRGGRGGLMPNQLLKNIAIALRENNAAFLEAEAERLRAKPNIQKPAWKFDLRLAIWCEARAAELRGGK